MGKRVFSAAERWAIYSVHGDRCYLHGGPIDLQTMEVDHIIPESLAADPQRLAGVLASLGLPEDFDLQSFANWMPACRTCNGKKRAEVFDPRPMIQIVLQRAARMAPRAADAAVETVSNQRLMKALNEIEREFDAKGLDPALIQPVIEALQKAARKPLVVRLVVPVDVLDGLVGVLTPGLPVPNISAILEYFLRPGWREFRLTPTLTLAVPVGLGNAYRDPRLTEPGSQTRPPAD